MLARRVVDGVLAKHPGALDRARRELQGALDLLREVFVHLLRRLRTSDMPPAHDAIPNSIVHLDTFVQMLSLRADDLLAKRQTPDH